jgi:hypothetical protein
MSSGIRVISNDDLLSELYANWFSDVSTDEKSTETETLDSDIATTSPGTVCVFRPDCSQ